MMYFDQISTSLVKISTAVLCNSLFFINYDNCVACRRNYRDDRQKMQRHLVEDSRKTSRSREAEKNKSSKKN